MWVVELAYGVPIPMGKVQAEQALIVAGQEGDHGLGPKFCTQVY